MPWDAIWCGETQWGAMGEAMGWYIVSDSEAVMGS